MASPKGIQAFQRVLIVGAGNIAGGFDEGRPVSDPPYTHAGAYSRDGRFNVEVCVEPNLDRRVSFMKAWSVPSGVGSIDETLNRAGQFDVVSVCSPTGCHVHDLETALMLKPKLIFCEKPVASLLRDSERLVDECRKAGVLLAVNHTRRWDPAIPELKADIQSGKWGQLRSVVGYYNKGILNNGSHMLDLLYLLFGPLEIVKVGKPISDFFPDDPTIPVWLESKDGLPIHLVCGHAGDFAFFELEIVFSGGVLTMEDGGFFWRERQVVENGVFKGYLSLEEGARRKGQYSLAMSAAVDNIYRAIMGGDLLASTGESALVAQRICSQIKQQVR